MMSKKRFPTGPGEARISPRTPIPMLLEKACARRETLRGVTNALRLVNSHGDGLPGLIVERYHRHFIIHLLPAAEKGVVDRAVEFIRRRYDPEYLIIKCERNKGGEEFDRSNAEVIINKAGSRTIVTEYGLHFQVDLDDTLNTGLFFDMRRNRKMVADLAREKEILNCFAYTCSFGVHCRARGASRVVNVDLSTKTLEKGRVNYGLNGLEPRENELVHADVLQYLNGAVNRGDRFDCIIIDPPTFARSRGEIFSVIKALPGLLVTAFSILKPGGSIFVATNCSKISPGVLQDHVAAAAARTGRTIQKRTALGQDVDFPGSGTMKESHLSCMLVTLQGG
jgi:23S rRNA (cytosine1962-C5)-methyltransferase